MKKVVESRKTLKHYELVSSKVITKNSTTGNMEKSVILKDYKELNPEVGDYIEVPEENKKIKVCSFVEFINNYSLVLDL